MFEVISVNFYENIKKIMKGKNQMVEFVDLTDWKKMRDIKFELHYEYGINLSRDGREFRYAVQKWNKRFFAGEMASVRLTSHYLEKSERRHSFERNSRQGKHPAFRGRSGDFVGGRRRRRFGF
jgi:hypothetical protein